MLLPVLLLALIAETLFRLYLSHRQAAYVLAHRDTVPPDFAAAVDLAAHRKAADYTVARLRLGRARLLIGLVLSVVFLWFGLDLLASTIATITPTNLLRSVLIILAYGAITELIGLPFQLWSTFVTEQRFGFNRTTPLAYLTDLLKGAALSLLISTPLLFAAFWLMRHGTGLWWLYAWAGFLAFTLALTEAFPRFIAPLFNRFTPLDGTLRPRLESLMARCGFRSNGLFVMDASKRSAKGNAYFTGIGRAKRIVLFDTLIDRHPPEEIEAVLAHELGHFRHRHVLIGTLRMAALSFLAFLCFGLLLPQGWLTTTLNLTQHDDALSALAFLMWFSALGPFLGLATNWWSRRAEFQADDFARKMVGADPMIGALTRLTSDSAGTLTPDPLYALFTYSHPPVPERVRHLRMA
jgi:STE24 endopeptidase